MIAFLTVLLLFLACLGFGAALLRGFGAFAEMTRAEQVVWSFAAGLGALGWLTFFAGIAGFLAPYQLIVLCAIGLPGLALFRRTPRAPDRIGPIDGLTAALLIGIALVVAANLIQALAPPADADTLAYHFALPKQFMAAGRIEFVPRAVDGAIPLLLQSTYLVALGIGGEVAVTLWTAVVSALAIAAFYVFARQFLNVNQALALALVFYTTPAVIDGAGSGQVEPKIVLFALGATYALVRLTATGRLGYAALAGAMAGFYAASKYLGLLFVVAAAISIVIGRARAARLLVYGIAVFVAGTQWYFWNWNHTGDPIFPALYRFLDLPDTEIWTQAWSEYFRAVIQADENPIVKTPWLFLTYPFIATLFPPPALDAGRVGLGAFGWLILPFAAAGAWRFRRNLAQSRYVAPALIVAGFYLLWLYTDSSQKSRHLLPVFPLLLLGLTLLATRWAERGAIRRPLIFVFALTLAVQFGAQGLYARNYVERLVDGESRDEFLARNIVGYQAVPWINSHLAADDRIVIFKRQLTYLIDAPVFIAHPLDQVLIQRDLAERDPAALLAQMRRQKATHMLYFGGAPGTPNQMDKFVNKMVDAGCGRIVATFTTRGISSRTLDKTSPTDKKVAILAINDSPCAL